MTSLMVKTLCKSVFMSKNQIYKLLRDKLNTYLANCLCHVCYPICQLRLVSLGNLEAAVSLLLSTPPEGANFYPNALRAVVLSSAVSQSLHELAVKVNSQITMFFTSLGM